MAKRGRPKKNQGSGGNELLLARAATEYIADHELRGVDYWYQFYSTHGISFERFKKQAAEDKWDQQRQTFWRGVQAGWLRSKAQRMLVRRDQELEQAMMLRSGVYSMVLPVRTPDGMITSIPPHSYEGMIGAFCRLDALVEDKRSLIAADLAPRLEEAEAGEEVDKRMPDLPLDEEDLRLLAHAMMARGREKRHRELGITDEQDDGGGTESGPQGGGEGMEGETGPGGFDRTGEVD